MTPGVIRPWVLSLSYSLRHPGVRWGAIVSAALALALCVVWIFVWWPVQREQTGLRRQIDTTRRAAVEAARAGELRRAYENAARTIDTAEKKLNYAASQADLVQQLAQLATRRGIRILSQSYSEGKAEADYQPLFLDLNLEGSYAALRNWLLDIPTLPIWIEVQDARLERARDTPGLVKVQARLMTYRPAASQGGAR